MSFSWIVKSIKLEVRARAVSKNLIAFYFIFYKCYKWQVMQIRSLPTWMAYIIDVWTYGHLFLTQKSNNFNIALSISIIRYCYNFWKRLCNNWQKCSGMPFLSSAVNLIKIHTLSQIKNKSKTLPVYVKCYNIKVNFVFRTGAALYI